MPLGKDLKARLNKNIPGDIRTIDKTENLGSVKPFDALFNAL